VRANCLGIDRTSLGHSFETKNGVHISEILSHEANKIFPSNYIDEIMPSGVEQKWYNDLKRSSYCHCHNSIFRNRHFTWNLKQFPRDDDNYRSDDHAPFIYPSAFFALFRFHCLRLLCSFNIRCKAANSDNYCTK